MRILMIILFILVTHFFMQAQTRSAKYVTVTNSSTVFSPAGLAEGTIVTNLLTAQTYVITAYADATDNLSTASKVLLGTTTGNNLLDYTGETILRTWDVGQVISGTVENEFEWQFYTPPTISCSVGSTLFFEVGTSNSIAISGSTTSVVGDVLSSGEVGTNGVEDPLLPVFGAAATYLYNITYAPIQTPINDWTNHTYTFQATQDYVGLESGTATSPARTINAGYPYLYGSSSQDFYSDTSTIYTTLTKWVKDDDATITVTGQDINNEYFWFGWPIEYDTITEVFYNNGATNWLTDFEKDTITVNSWSLTNNWDDVQYIFLRTKTLKIGIVNSTWDFNQ